ncbi:MAG: AAA family ATPase [Candidatus Ratteibacteria bacterium]|nr:AAA family ATPase [Candidatus Ratteibacteria bacterium]
MKKKLKLSLEKLRWKCAPDLFKFKTTAKLPPFDGVIGQKRALHALDFGLGITGAGFNIYVSGPIGTGRSSTVKSAVGKIAAAQPVPEDLCYLHNFRDSSRPTALFLPAGMGNHLVKDMDEVVNDLKSEIPKGFESPEYQEEKSRLLKSYEKEREEIFGSLNEKAKSMHFALKKSLGGITAVPLKRNQPMSEEDYERLSGKEKKELRAKNEELQNDLDKVLRKVREVEKKIKERIKKIETQIVLFSVRHIMEEGRQKYKDFPKLQNYFNEVQEDVLENFEDFRKQQEFEFPMPGLKFPAAEPSFTRYKVNVAVDNSRLKGAPVIVESNPTYLNLIGKIEYRARFGSMVTDFTMIKAGTLLEANGGYLIIQALDVLRNFFSWEGLKRCIKNNEAAIENIGEQFSLMSTSTLKPEAVPIKLKIIMIGNPFIYHLLYVLDEDFRKLFKVKADFDVQMARNIENITEYASFISAFCRREKLLHFDRGAAAKVVEYSVRIAGDREKLSTHFIEIADLINEADYWAQKDKAEVISAEHVETAIRQKIKRSSQIEERIQELIAHGTIMIDTEGRCPGQLNGISILDLGDYIFGKPSRITAKTYMGQGGVMDIERKAKMGGNIHHKGTLIISGFLGSLFAQDKPLCFSASICFEQLYEEVEGDSASSAELYAIISDLAGLPIDQQIAVTGSVNQHGQIQPIGGVNQKIEGFFYTCKVKSLTGNQGVMIPEANIRHLMLRDEVIDEVKKGKFHIWAVRTIEEGIEILTGKPAGKKQADGTFPEGTVFYLVDKRLRDLAAGLKRFAGQTKTPKK